jgi:hexosaminidase
MLLAVPELRDPGETGTYASVQGFPNNCLNPALPATYPVIRTILDELIALFPSKFVHVGADEVPLAAWSGSPLALARLEEIGGPALAAAHAALRDTTGHHDGADAIEGSATALLQAEFLGRIQRHLASRGCVTGGWQEAAHGDVIDRDESYLVGWRDVAASGRLAAEGHAIVVSPGQAYYLDMALSSDWDEPGAGWAGWSGLRETYEFDPVAGWTRPQLARLMGVQACIWSEPMADRAVFDRLVFPRLSAIAETAWTPADARSWDRFAALCGLMPNLYGHHQA